jgi:hypothetical protein
LASICIRTQIQTLNINSKYRSFHTFMKTPNILKVIPIIALSISAIFGWSAITRASQTEASTAKDIAPSTPDQAFPVDSDRVAQMDREINRIASRLGVSAPMEDSQLIDSREIQRMADEGFIVDVTLEEVEAAVSAAAKTPETGDDIDALVLKNRGSYRFFAPE